MILDHRCQPGDSWAIPGFDKTLGGAELVEYHAQYVAHCPGVCGMSAAATGAGCSKSVGSPEFRIQEKETAR